MIPVEIAALYKFTRGDFRGHKIGDVACSDYGLEYVAFVADRAEHFGEDALYCEAFIRDRVINAALQEIRARTRADAKAREKEA